LQILYVAGFFSCMLYLYDYDLVYSHCSGITPSSETFISIFALSVLVTLIFSLVVFRRLLRRNEKFLQRRNESLSERYQIKENIRTLKLLLPLVETQFALNFTPILVWLCYATIPHGFDPRAYPIFE
ncbi:hypothetical protein PMAYCL1PPCAC_21843, partial [Pristionchus mayeri]